MKRFLLQTIIISLAVVLTLTILSLISDYGLKKTEGYRFELSEIARGNINADLLISGNSRACRHISPAILDSVLAVNSYNLGADALDYSLQKLRYDFYNQHNPKVKYVLLSVDNLALMNLIKFPDPLVYLPFLNDTLVSNTLKQYEHFRWIDYHTPFAKYQYNKQMLFGIYMATGIQDHLKLPYAETRYKGYRGIPEKNSPWNDDTEGFLKDRAFKQESFENFENFIKELKNSQIKVILVYSPQFIEYQKTYKDWNFVMSLYRNISFKYDIPLLDYSSDTLSYSRDYFCDPLHMNKKGSELFTLKLANDLKKIKFDK